MTSRVIAAVCIALCVLLFCAGLVRAKADKSAHWQTDSVEVWDATPFPELVDTVVANWNVSGLHLTVTRRLADCPDIPQGVILICADHYGIGQRASWAFLEITGGRRIIKSAVVGINLDYSVWTLPELGQSRQYLMCHESGGALGLIEARWPAFLPDGSMDRYHYGCMNLQFQGPEPSAYDIDRLRQLYGEPATVQ